ncbi:MAG: CRISPR system precrRNA processing endoribonuclease RAMP protein Cas6 [Spirochaetota bacterium]
MNYVTGLQFPVYSFVFTLKLTSTIEFRNFPGIAFRGAFGHTLKRLVCVLPGEKKYCDHCYMRFTCVYARVFESPGHGKDRMQKATHYPHPFTITPRIEYPAIYGRDARLTIHVSLLADGYEYLPYFLYTFQEMGRVGVGRKRGTFELEKVELFGTGVEVYIAGSGFLRENIKPVLKEPWNITSELQVEFVSPCKIKSNGSYLEKADFSEIIKSAARRYENIGNLHGDGSVDIGRDRLLEKAIEIKKIEENIQWNATVRYSKRQQRKMPMEGFTGYARYTGDFTPFAEVLRFAELSNIGSNTTFGFGSIRLKFT